MAWNGFKANVRLSMIRRLKQRYAVDDNENTQINGNTASSNTENSLGKKSG